jgi:hypothetical protein
MYDRHETVTISRVKHEYLLACVAWGEAQNHYEDVRLAKDRSIDRHEREAAREHERLAWMARERAYKDMNDKRFAMWKHEEEFGK